MEDAKRVVLDGLPVWWADVPGPFTAALCFRAGRADETLPRGGVTHLVEHLALSAVGRREHEFNGFVDDTICAFYADGGRAEVLEFVELVATALADLPVERLEHERRVLRVEASQSSPGVRDPLLVHRFGPAGFGLPGTEEVGLRVLEAADVREWCARRFTRENAVAWMSGEPPETLAVALRRGKRVPVPAAEPVALRLPGFVAGGTEGVAIAMTGERESPLSIALRIAEERLVDELRHRLGIAYAVDTIYTPLDASTAHVVLAADCRHPDAPAVLAELWRVLQALASDGAREEELERIRRRTAREQAEPGFMTSQLAFAAECELSGMPYRSPAELLELQRAFSGADVGATMGALLGSALLLGPEGTRAPDAALHDPPFVPRPRIDGERFRPRAAGLRRRRADEDLWVGETGLTWRDGEAEYGYPFDRIAAVEWRPDGELQLSTLDGWWLRVSPYAWEDGARAVELIRSRVPAGMLVPPADRELSAAIERAVSARIADPAPVAAPLNALPDELDPAEGVVELALAVRVNGTVVGLLALTERRLLWLASLDEDERFDVPLSRLEAVERRGGRLDLRWDAGAARLDLTPKESAQAIERALGRLRA